LRSGEAPVVLCSAGDFYGSADEFNEPKSHFVARMMGHLGYDAIGVGETDLNYGLAKLVDDVESYGLHVTCANLFAKGEMERRLAAPDGSAQARLKTVFPPYLVVERDATRFGFVALLAPDTKIRTRARGDTVAVEALTYLIGDPRKAAEAVIPEARDSCDVLVLLAHMERRHLEELLPDFPDVDIVVLGHSPQTSAIGRPDTVGRALVVKATSQGQNVGQMRITVDADGRIADVNNRIHFLGSDYEDDPEMNALVEEFEAENRKIQKVLFAKSQLRSSGTRGSSPYLGLGACQGCHAEEFEVYKGTRHARAYATLSEQFVHRDTNCVGCHVTGWGKRGGFDGMRHRGSELDLIDVQCEACHGPGSQHSRDGSYVDTAIESCARCHTENDDPDFDFEKDWAKIAH
jgi:2',3'-cyclic-nucleotide 2'-phosphodiesterase (5'-nucleotidase family)